jgi:hypothetical protein
MASQVTGLPMHRYLLGTVALERVAEAIRAIARGPTAPA